MLDETLVAFAGLGFFLAGLTMLSEVVRSLAARRLRLALARFSRLPFANVAAGALLGAVTQSTSASAFICIGLLSARAISFAAALTVTAWSGVGTAVLVFLASVDLRLVALTALSITALFHVTALHRSDAGRRSADMLLAIGVTLFGLTMLKTAGHALGGNAWVQEFFTFAADSWIYSFLIGFLVTLVMQSSSTVTILAVMLSAAGLMPLAAAVVLVCGANAGSGVSVVMISAHLTGLPRQLAIWQAVVKLAGVLALLPVALALDESGPLAARLAALMPVPMLLSVTYLLINLLGALLTTLLRAPLLRLLDRLCPLHDEHRQFAPEFIVDEAAEDPETAFLLARQEQAKLVSLLPAALDPVRPGEAAAGTVLEKGARRSLARGLAEEISDFVSEAVNRHPGGSDVGGLLLLQRCNEHILPIIDALHGYVEELASLGAMAAQERAMAESMSESLHLLLELAAEQAGGDGDAEMLARLTGDRSEVMTRFRRQIAGEAAQSNASRESLLVASALFERMVWLVRQLSADMAAIAEAGGAATTG